jgi:enoyl-CoA hydratase
VSALVELTLEGPLALLTLKRAEKLNALDRAMIDALGDAARSIEASRDVRVAILSGEGKGVLRRRGHRGLERSSGA